MSHPKRLYVLSHKNLHMVSSEKPKDATMIVSGPNPELALQRYAARKQRELKHS